MLPKIILPFFRKKESGSNTTTNVTEKKMDEKVTGKELVVDQCYIYKEKYMGKFIASKITGPSYDQDEEYIFENGSVGDGFHQFTKDFTPVNCAPNTGGKRKSQRRNKKTKNTKKNKKIHRKI